MEFSDKRILVTGGAGFLGKHVVARLQTEGVQQQNITIPRSQEHDLRQKDVCKKLVASHDIVIHLAARVGGIGYNKQHPAELFYDNLIMGANLMHEAHAAGISKFVAIGTVCAYPKHTPVPFKEDDLWNGYPEETNAPYGIAKKALLEQAQAYRTQYGFNAIYLLPVNLYGPHDNFDLRSSHVIPALIRKMVDAQRAQANSVEIWGTGTASREFLFVEDAADGIVKATIAYDKPAPVNLGSGREITIKELAQIIQRLVGFEGELTWDTTKPDGQPRRCLDTSRAQHEFNFTAQTPFEDGLRKTIEWYKKQYG